MDEDDDNNLWATVQNKLPETKLNNFKLKAIVTPLRINI